MSLASKYLKLVQAGYTDYTGPIGAYEFVNGVSTVLIPRVDRDRLAAAFQFVEFTEEGVDEIPAGVAERLVANASVRASDEGPSQRMTEEEKAAEDALIALTKDDNRVIYSLEDLQKIADKKGINGLREVAAPWDVKHRGVKELIALIVQAQNNWLAERQAAFERRVANRSEFEQSLVPEKAETVPNAPVEETAPAETSQAPVEVENEDEDDEIEPDPVEIPSPDVAEDEPATSPEQAAESGDLSAALNQE